MKRMICALLVLIVVCVTCVSASAIDYGCDVSTVSKAVYLENLDTGAVVFEKNAEEKMYPASTTKIMTYVVVADNVSDLDGTMVTIKEEVFADIDPESTVMGLKDHIGEQYSVRELLYGMMLPSGNDAALVLADYVGEGSIPAFVDKMNAKAAELKCSDTHFVNPHGLFDAAHYTTAKDMAAITKYAATTQSFMEIANTVSYTPTRFTEPITNTNYMLSKTEHGGQYYDPCVRGVKTGYLDEAGKCLVTTGEQDGFHYLCVALGADYSYEDDINYAMIDTSSLYDWAFTNIAFQTVYSSSEVVKTIDVNFGKDEDKLNLVPDGELTALLPNNYDQSKIRVDMECPDEIDAPVSQDQVIGKATVYYDDMLVGSTDIVANKAIELDEVQYRLEQVKIWFKNHLVLIIVIAVVIILLIILLVAVSKAQKRKRARERAQRARRRYRD
ncbi:MAG: D-alanyl-D-alanine carboxypeptidase [Ruminococcus sp.]|uniref:D-alanyl-D-alanine carboxypeptidase family protein n=1 Tax=Ruminococcus sp. TaxID=41978 RepID=UPI002873705E|nr:D-alanyl-D-alanine carboxypeptidase family protein [Ruminococcus sp.]MBQ3285520.1 D-alanyl-D-alanine carboxypeptidase [Ruminococcus sp.]